MNQLLAELKRRKVFKVGAAYLVVAWLAVQAVSIGFPAFDAPPWALRVLILMAMLGFPIALLISWMFDMTPDGIRTEGGSARATIGVYVAAAVLAGLALGWYFKGQPSYRVGDVPANTHPSVAVLPLANMSGKPDEDYFSDGMTEELLNVLAQIPKLNVPGTRSSPRAISACCRRAAESGLSQYYAFDTAQDMYRVGINSDYRKTVRSIIPMGMQVAMCATCSDVRDAEGAISGFAEHCDFGADPAALAKVAAELCGNPAVAADLRYQYSFAVSVVLNLGGVKTSIQNALAALRAGSGPEARAAP